MSLIPLPEARRGPYKERKYPADVTGTANISYGHRLKERARCVPGKPGSRPGQKRDVEERPEDRREREHLAKVREFETETNRRIRRKRLALHLRQEMAAHEEDVNTRREKLRELILSEEVALTRQIVDQTRLDEDTRLNETRLKAEQLEKLQEQQRSAVVAAKRMQQYFARCPEIRSRLAAKTARQVKLDNLAQITDNEAKKRSDQELDRLWHQLMLKEIAAKEEREIEEQKRRELTDRETIATLSQQIAGKLALEEDKRRVQQEEREHLERLWENVRREELSNLDRERKTRESLKRDLEEQIITAKRFLAERAREEAAMDRAMKALADEELAKERASITESSAALHKELLAYLQYLEEIRQEESRRSLEVDAIVEQSLKDAEARRDLAVKRSREARERSLRETVRGRDEQLRMKREEERRENEARQLEKELLEKQIELDGKLTTEERARARQRAACYGKELREQQERCAEARRRREVEEEERIRGEEANREEEYRRLTEELLASSENITPHPFKVLLKECAARRAAERDGHCYCPPPLSPD